MENINTHLVLGAGTGIDVENRWVVFFNSLEKEKEWEWDLIDYYSRLDSDLSRNRLRNNYIYNFNEHKVWKLIYRNYDTIRFDISTSKFSDLSNIFFQRISKILKNNGIFYLQLNPSDSSIVIITDKEISDYKEYIDDCYNSKTFIQKRVRHILDFNNIMFDELVTNKNKQILEHYFSKVNIINENKSITPIHNTYGGKYDYYECIK